jgi:PQQ-dependent dehydrogenase (methanol/ethanol family)
MGTDNTDSTEQDYALIPEERHEYVEHGPLADEDTVELQQKAPGNDVSDSLLRSDADRPDSWLNYNKGLEQNGFSPADRLTRENVSSLSKEYIIKTDSNGLQTNPIVVPGDPPVLYFTTTNFKVKAVNARTGDPFWTTQIQMADNPGGIAWANRGVTVWKDKVYIGVPTPEIVALNRYTGNVQWKESILSTDQRAASLSDRVSITQAPLAYNGHLLFGQSGDYGGWTFVNSMDAETGNMEWQVRAAPRSEWVGDSWQFSSSAAWMSPSVDHKSGTVFFSIGNPDPMLNGVVRPGPNRYSNSVMAVDVESGEMKWAHQNIAHETWDYDTHVSPTVFDIKVGGETRRALILEDKGGNVYVIDAETGRLLERPEAPLKQDHEWAQGFLAMPPAGEQNKGRIWPGFSYAGVEWPPDTYSRRTGWRYVGANTASNDIWYNPDWAYEEEKSPEIEIGGGYEEPKDTGEHFSEVVATDPASGLVQWKHTLQDVNPDWPMSKLFTGGTTSTAGGLVFHGSSGGHLIALNDETGDLLWRGNLGDRHIKTGPVVWDDSAAGKQYVAIAVDDRVAVYASSG